MPRDRSPSTNNIGTNEKRKECSESKAPANQAQEILIDRQGDCKGHREKRLKTEPTQEDPNKIRELYERVVRSRDQELRGLRTQYQEALKSMDQKGVEAENLLEQNITLANDLDELKDRYSLQRKTLEQCQDELFRLQPANPIPDLQIVAQYNTLCARVSDWVNTEVSNSEKDRDSEQAVSGNSDSFTKSFLEESPTMECYILENMIHSHLQKYLLGNTFLYYGLPNDETSTIRKVEDMMAKAESQREASAIGTWRSDTLQALARQPALLERRDQLTHSSTAYLFGELCLVFPGLQGHSLRRLEQEVVSYAADLEAKIHLSSTSYWFSEMQSAGTEFDSIKKNDLSHSTFVDVKTGKKVNSKSPGLTLSSKGFAGKPLLMVFPSLSRCEGDGKKMVLCPSKQIIEFH